MPHEAMQKTLKPASIREALTLQDEVIDGSPFDPEAAQDIETQLRLPSQKLVGPRSRRKRLLTRSMDPDRV